MARKYLTPEEHLAMMKVGEEGLKRVGPGETGVMYLKKGNKTEPHIIEAGAPEGYKPKAKIIIGKTNPDGSTNEE